MGFHSGPRVPSTRKCSPMVDKSHTRFPIFSVFYATIDPELDRSIQIYTCFNPFKTTPKFFPPPFSSNTVVLYDQNGHLLRQQRTTSTKATGKHPFAPLETGPSHGLYRSAKHCSEYFHPVRTSGQERTGVPHQRRNLKNDRTQHQNVTFCHNARINRHHQRNDVRSRKRQLILGKHSFDEHHWAS